MGATLGLPVTPRGIDLEPQNKIGPAGARRAARGALTLGEIAKTLGEVKETLGEVKDDTALLRRRLFELARSLGEAKLPRELSATARESQTATRELRGVTGTAIAQQDVRH